MVFKALFFMFKAGLLGSVPGSGHHQQKDWGDRAGGGAGVAGLLDSQCWTVFLMCVACKGSVWGRAVRSGHTKVPRHRAVQVRGNRTSFSTLSHCRRETSQLKQLWDFTFMVQTLFREWESTLWIEIDVENMDTGDISAAVALRSFFTKLCSMCRVQEVRQAPAGPGQGDARVGGPGCTVYRNNCSGCRCSGHWRQTSKTCWPACALSENCKTRPSRRGTGTRSIKYINYLGFFIYYFISCA